MLALGIETSCDETAAAIVRDDGKIVAQRVLSQLDDHAPYGGVVPEIAARAHLAHLHRLLRECMEEAGIGYGALSVIGATNGPGLIGGVMVGAVMAKAIASSAGKPFVAVNHLEAHALTPRLSHHVPFPYLLLLVSGGHTQLIVAEDVGRYRLLGTTIDDAAGEAFDKGAKLLGLPYPGGPALEQAARRSNAPLRFDLPRPMKGREDCRFSFSGLKTALRQRIAALPQPLGEDILCDLAAAYQAAIADCLTDRASRAIRHCRRELPLIDTLVAAGGVASNGHIRASLENLAGGHGMKFIVPPVRLCTDNGAMIAWAALESFKKGLTDPLSAPARPRWPLDPAS